MCFPLLELNKKIYCYCQYIFEFATYTENAEQRKCLYSDNVYALCLYLACACQVFDLVKCEKITGFCRFVYIYKRNPKWKTSFLVILTEDIFLSTLPVLLWQNNRVSAIFFSLGPFYCIYKKPVGYLELSRIPTMELFFKNN